MLVNKVTKLDHLKFTNKNFCESNSLEKKSTNSTNLQNVKTIKQILLHSSCDKGNHFLKYENLMLNISENNRMILIKTNTRITYFTNKIVYKFQDDISSRFREITI